MSRGKIDPSIVEQVSRAVGKKTDKLLVSFNEAVGEFLDYAKLRGLSEHTISSYAKELKQIFRYLVDYDIDTDDIRALNVEVFENFVRTQLEKGYAHTTINVRLRTAKIFGNFCVRKKYIEYNHASDVQALKVRKRIGDTFTKKQLKLLLDTPDISTFAGLRDLTIMTTFADTGIRLNELCSIKTGDIVFSDKSMNVQRTKNGYARRIPLTTRLRTLLKAYMKVRGVLLDTDILFVTTGDDPIDPRTVQFQIKEHGRKSGLLDEVQCSPHVFRRTFAKFKVQAGVDIFTLQRLMGHSDISELRNYVAIYSTDMDAAIEKGIE